MQSANDLAGMIYNILDEYAETAEEIEDRQNRGGALIRAWGREIVDSIRDKLDRECLQFSETGNARLVPIGNINAILDSVFADKKE